MANLQNNQNSSVDGLQIISIISNPYGEVLQISNEKMKWLAFYFLLQIFYYDTHTLFFRYSHGIHCKDISYMCTDFQGCLWEFRRPCTTVALTIVFLVILTDLRSFEHPPP